MVSFLSRFVHVRIGERFFGLRDFDCYIMHIISRIRGENMPQDGEAGEPPRVRNKGSFRTAAPKFRVRRCNGLLYQLR